MAEKKLTEEQKINQELEKRYKILSNLDPLDQKAITQREKILSLEQKLIAIEDARIKKQREASPLYKQIENSIKANVKALNQNKYDFIFYIAGVDIHFEDRLGKLKITDAGVNKRDQIVIENFYQRNTPLCGVLGGGYNKSFEKLIELHSMLHKNCAEIIR